MSIFISIASYQDPLLVSTIFSAYENAQNHWTIDNIHILGIFIFWRVLCQPFGENTFSKTHPKRNKSQMGMECTYIYLLLAE